MCRQQCINNNNNYLYRNRLLEAQILSSNFNRSTRYSKMCICSSSNNNNNNNSNINHT